MTINPLQTVSTQKAYEVRHWMRELRCTETELHLAILAVGNGLDDIRLYRKMFAGKRLADSLSEQLPRV